MMTRFHILALLCFGVHALNLRKTDGDVVAESAPLETDQLAAAAQPDPIIVTTRRTKEPNFVSDDSIPTNHHEPDSEIVEQADEEIRTGFGIQTKMNSYIYKVFSFFLLIFEVLQ